MQLRAYAWRVFAPQFASCIAGVLYGGNCVGVTGGEKRVDVLNFFRRHTGVLPTQPPKGQTPMRKITSLAFLIVAVAAAACTTSPTTPSGDPHMGARFDGGIFAGSGNSAVTTPPPPPSENTTTAGTEVTAADSSNSRGGVFAGSGN